MKPVQLDLSKYNRMVEDYHAESDRAAAVLAGSFMDEYLRKFLRSLMVADAPLDEMLTSYGPLGSFRARIDCLYAFGFIDAGIRDDLGLIRKIRNHFAHHPEHTSFDESPVKDHCANLSTAQAIRGEDGTESRIDDRRSQYLFAIGSIVGRIHNEMLAREARKPK